MSLGEKIATLRKRRKWTQGAFAEKMGVHAHHVTRWESNRQRPSGQTLEKMAQVFEVSLDELVDPQTLATGFGADVELVEKMTQLRELDADDRAMVFRMIETLSTVKRMDTMLLSRRTTGTRVKTL